MAQHQTKIIVTLMILLVVALPMKAPMPSLQSNLVNTTPLLVALLISLSIVKISPLTSGYRYSVADFTTVKTARVITVRGLFT
ncbi:MAG: hypothetical protein ACPHWY_09270 [Pseudoalteromonas tetraodonis]